MRTFMRRVRRLAQIAVFPFWKWAPGVDRVLSDAHKYAGSCLHQCLPSLVFYKAGLRRPSSTSPWQIQTTAWPGMMTTMSRSFVPWPVMLEGMLILVLSQTRITTNVLTSTPEAKIAGPSRPESDVGVLARLV